MWISFKDRVPFYYGNYLLRVIDTIYNKTHYYRVDYKLENDKLVFINDFKNAYFLLEHILINTNNSTLITDWWEDPIASNDERTRKLKLNFKTKNNGR